MFEFLLALLVAGTVGVLLVPLLRRSVAGTDRLDNDLALYRDQLAEVERERASGALSEAEAAAARIEIERRLLAAAELDKGARPRVSPTLHRVLPPALALLVPLFALGLYLQIGKPGLRSVPSVAERAAPDRPNVEALRARAALDPNDGLAQSEFGEALTIEADGTVPAPAVEAFRRALKLQPDDPRAAYYLGLHEAQSGDSRAALQRWQELVARAPADAPYLPMLRAEIQRVAKAAGLPVPDLPSQPAPDERGPTREQVEMMQNLTPEQRQQAIRSMVEGLDAKLRDSPNDRAGWLRLAQARKVLGEADKAAEAYARADALQPLEPRLLADWAEALIRQIAPGTAPPAATVAVLERLEKAEPRNGLVLFYLGAAAFASGDKPAAARRWKTLLTLLPADAPIRGLLEQKIKEAEAP